MGLLSALGRVGGRVAGRMLGGNNARIMQIEQEVAALPRAQQIVVADVFEKYGADAAERLLQEVRRLSAASPNPMHWTQRGPI